MTLQREYDRPYQTNEPESSENSVTKNVYRQIKSRYPQKEFTIISDKHTKLFKA